MMRMDEKVMALERILRKDYHRVLRIGDGANGQVVHKTVEELLQERYRSEPMEKLLSRFLYCCDEKVEFAAETLLKDMEWRASVDIETLMRRSPEEILGCDPSLVHTKFLSKFHGVDREGRSVIYYLARTLDAKGVLQCTTLERYLLYQAWVRETQIRKQAYDSPHIHAPYFTSVMDCQGVRLAQANRTFYTIIKGIADLDQWHFPGMVRQMVLVNVPFFFTIVWKVIRKFLSAEVEQKISFAGSGRELYNALNAIIPNSEIPSSFHGAGEDLNWSTLDTSYLEPFQLVEPISSPSPVIEADELRPETREIRSPSSLSRNISSEGSFPRISSSHGSEGQEEEEEQEEQDQPPLPSSPQQQQFQQISDVELYLSQRHDGEDVETLLQTAAIGTTTATATATSDESMLDPKSCIPPHIAVLVYDRSDPPRPGLRSDLLQTIEAVVSEKDSFERYALEERRRLRGRLRHVKAKTRREKTKTHQGSLIHSSFLKDPANLEIVKSGLRARIAALQEEIANARDECQGYAKAVKFARNYLEQEALKREGERKELEVTVKQLRKENEVLRSAVQSSLGNEVLASIVGPNDDKYL